MTIVILCGWNFPGILNRIFRLLNILDYNVENILESMEELKILTVYDRLYLRRDKFMYKVSKMNAHPISTIFFIKGYGKFAYSKIIIRTFIRNF